MSDTVTIDGISYYRSYVVELEPGDVTAFDETVESVERITDNRTFVRMVDGNLFTYGKADTTILVRV
jgi:hypothetical protein